MCGETRLTRVRRHCRESADIVKRYDGTTESVDGWNMKVFRVREKIWMEGTESLSGNLKLVCIYPIVIYD